MPPGQFLPRLSARLFNRLHHVGPPLALPQRAPPSNPLGPCLVIWTIGPRLRLFLLAGGDRLRGAGQSGRGLCPLRRSANRQLTCPARLNGNGRFADPATAPRRGPSRHAARRSCSSFRPWLAPSRRGSSARPTPRARSGAMPAQAGCRGHRPWVAARKPRSPAPGRPPRAPEMARRRPGAAPLQCSSESPRTAPGGDCSGSGPTLASLRAIIWAGILSRRDIMTIARRFSAGSDARRGQRPEGTLEAGSAVPSGRTDDCTAVPGAEAPGYCRVVPPGQQPTPNCTRLRQVVEMPWRACVRATSSVTPGDCCRHITGPAAGARPTPAAGGSRRNRDTKKWKWSASSRKMSWRSLPRAVM